ncbi:hypothetical protein EUZ85_13860 [Hahella sp. KA22]|uniref:hypothetical protein n=1 Tax=Hahella sp. KA22 TaxID=1628392 RepID=UPI000FDE8A16|nr:hypothetical protein [Hahella sp. KA22]AZZ91756.1 hypothetical protein ENC22_11300 [Hahella sp. KA22]QAY55126.1 hypothetical protein EUZ85_13860 [Hahella sp. KA22]
MPRHSHLRFASQRAGAATLALAIALPLGAGAADISVTSAYLSPEIYWYPQNGAPIQDHGNAALAGSAELFTYLPHNWSLKATPYGRVDFVDDNRHRVDFKELDFEYFHNSHIVNIGLRHVSWSTVEAVNVLPLQVADVINQRDIAGDPAGQDKLGAPSVRYAYQAESMQYEFYALPWFRERTLPSREARENPTRGQLEFDEDDALFTDDRDNHRLGYALRVEKVTGEVNLAAFHYDGYRQDPLFVPGAEPGHLRPLYYKVRTTGFTVQGTAGSWLYKGEFAYNNTEESSSRYALPTDFLAAVAGAEYTFIRPEEQADLSVFAEYIYDSRGDDALGTPFDQDLFVGVRWASNDYNDSTLIVGAIADLNHSAAVYHLNFKRRLTPNIAMELTLRGYDPDDSDPLYPLRDDQLINASFTYYFD